MEADYFELHLSVEIKVVTASHLNKNVIYFDKGNVSYHTRSWSRFFPYTLKFRFMVVLMLLFSSAATKPGCSYNNYSYRQIN